jgi:hypothetical protein
MPATVKSLLLPLRRPEISYNMGAGRERESDRGREGGSEKERERQHRTKLALNTKSVYL